MKATAVGAKAIKTLAPASHDSTWFCDFCAAEMWTPRLIYGVPLCFLCIARVAGDPKFGYHQSCKIYELEAEVRRLKRILQNLRRRLEKAEARP